jgi:hypothetical protein
MVREGWAIDFMPYSCERFRADEDDARREGRGMWSGCFVEPRGFRYSGTSAALLGNKCPNDPGTARLRLLGIEATGPDGYAINGKVHGHWQILTRGIFHLPGCRDYRKTTIEPSRGDQWFCSEEEAIAGKFRKAKNCVTQKPPPQWAVRCR